ncbi:hypothetical protein ACJQWK_03133 [Exserohilum turcicum]|uniref:Uncharacterized protein n=1 Tax=Exserohilum turcicum (strain 28A) TaxID=671987 RepID=R0JY09_EXST2|nr:uncharacterized protein SETTUDRAFT_28987 [Exserohilum turcica Et28A]EOA85808.1 hypothetical protein SETTUDRAFT_28987 [Exserohilum turcica Et28A]
MQPVPQGIAPALLSTISDCAALVVAAPRARIHNRSHDVPWACAARTSAGAQASVMLHSALVLVLVLLESDYGPRIEKIHSGYRALGSLSALYAKGGTAMHMRAWQPGYSSLAPAKGEPDWLVGNGFDKVNASAGQLVG